ncbi:Protein Ycf2 [Bienertia sinuspersici]
MLVGGGSIYGFKSIRSKKEDLIIISSISLISSISEVLYQNPSIESLFREIRDI